MDFKYMYKHIESGKLPAGSKVYALYNLEQKPFSPHWAIRHAFNNPDQLFEAQYTEGSYTYTGQYMYHSEEKIFTVYNQGLGIRCPLWVHHHIGSTCKCCGLKD